ncbi:MAG: phage major capsid protein [Firmicutes bacterium]|nr:phage major capsid protein [Bacillota bacterium]
MGATVERGTTLFPHELVSDVFNKVTGHSSLAKLAGTTPVSFSGTDIFTFSLDSEANIVAESGQKTNGGATVGSVKIMPVKVEYGARVSDEFLRSSDERQLNMLSAFADGYAKKIGRAIDIMGMHGMNPRTGALASTIIGTNSLGTNTSVNSVTYNASTLENNIIDAIAAIGDYMADGIAMAPAFATALAKAKDGNGNRIFPELGWGQSASNVRGLRADVNSTVSYAVTGQATNNALAIVGDFAECFKWGYAANIPMELIEYGDPDGNGDLKRLNQVFLRAEAYIGWAILDPTAFTVIKSA